MSHDQYPDCLDACNACADACDHCATACLSEEHVGMMAECVRNDIDCAAACRLAAGLMARGNIHAAEMCALCAHICETCAEECEKHDHEHCKVCAAACRKCATECRKMAA